MQTNLFEQACEKTLSEELFEAYFECRRNKRNTINALQFEKHLEQNLFQLFDEIIEGTYVPARSIAFIVNKPVKREIFAADFRDRVVHHFLINKLNPLFEQEFIEDSYACRVGKGTHFGIKQAYSFIKGCSESYKTDCYVLKLDIEGFFMHINRKLLFEKLRQFILDKYHFKDRELVIQLCRILIFNDPTKNCIIKGSVKDWEGLPDNKSLFHSPHECGLPIGNLTSQVFANFYMNTFDHFIKNELNLSFYGRYVDDFVLVHVDKEYLKNLIPEIALFLQEHLMLTLHPKKIYLQHFSKGVRYLGAVIKKNRIYIARRTLGNFYAAIQRQNSLVNDRKPNQTEKEAFLSSMNSYLGIMKHYRTFNIRKGLILKNLHSGWWKYIYAVNGFTKFKKKAKKRKVP